MGVKVVQVLKRLGLGLGVEKLVRNRELKSRVKR